MEWVILGALALVGVGVLVTIFVRVFLDVHKKRSNDGL